MRTLDNITEYDIKRIFGTNCEVSQDRRTREIVYGSSYIVEKANNKEDSKERDVRGYN